jgi:SPP1 gp7 family putative phage head morphogenesis protein
MKNSEYWRGRFEQLEEAHLKKGLAYYDGLEREYRKAVEAIEEKIAHWYGRIAKNNEITYAEAKRLLTKNELAEFRWSVEEYIKYGKENAINGAWMKELENASAKVHISRLEALKLQMQQQVEVLYGNQVDGLDKTLRRIYSEGYYHTAYEIQRGFNVGYDLQRLNDRQIADVISKPWAADGKNFSSRIWTAKDQLVNTLHTELTQAIIRGDSPKKAIKVIRDKFEVSKNNAGRLVMTESAFFASAAQKDCFKSLGVEQYEIVATLDSRTSNICQELDGKVFAMTDYQPGVTAPPFHCWCRTVTAPYFADNFGERAARDTEGKVYYVPSDMKYPEWYKTFVGGGSKDGLKELTKNGIVKIDFTPAKTIQEANEYATQTLGIPRADYTGLHIDVANEWNRGLTDYFNRFPELKQRFGFVGEAHARNATLKPVASQYYLGKLKELNPDIGDDILKAHVDARMRQIMRKLSVSSDAYAMSWSPKDEPYRWFAGVTFNSVQGKDIDKLLRGLEVDVANKFHPEGCNTIKSVLDHEIGHQLDEMLWLSNLASVQKLFDTRTGNQITDELSKYAWKNGNRKKYSEFVAEAWAEYCNNPNPRPIAKEIGETVEREYSQWKKQNI